MTLNDIRKELGVYNKTINNYLSVFDYTVNTKDYLIKPQRNGIRDYQEITNKMVDFLLLHKSRLVEFEKDYYKRKTIEEISKKVGIKLQIVIDYFQAHLSKFKEIQFKGNNPTVFNQLIISIEADYNCYQSWVNNYVGIVEKNTKCNKISSYHVLKEIQCEDLKNIIAINTVFD